jgi:GH24 family phage-related lysozyme (muramidase)
MTWSSDKLRDFFLHYDSNNPNHVRAADILQQAATEQMNDDAHWVKVFRENNNRDQAAAMATPFIAEFEGFSPSVYKCPAGVWTIGYGTTHYPDGTLVWPKDKPISEKTAKAYLKHEIEKIIIPVLEKSIPTWGPMNINQKAATISFAYNLGAYFYGSKGFTTITKALSSQVNWSNVPSALMLYVNPNSAFEPGLRRRRKAEGDLWCKK